MKGIMFNERYGLETAVLNGSKTRTTRIEKFCKEAGENVKNGFPRQMYLHNEIHLFNKEETGAISYKTRYRVGDIVAIKQAYNIAIHQLDWANRLIYKNDAGWTNKMFVRADLMPHQIKITGVKLKRLQDISDEDCMNEGIMKGDFINTWDKYYYDIIGDCAIHKTFKTPQEAFAGLIDKISGKGTWDRNEYNVVYYFKLVK